MTALRSTLGNGGSPTTFRDLDCSVLDDPSVPLTGTERVDFVIVVWRQGNDEICKIVSQCESICGPIGKIWVINNNPNRDRPSHLSRAIWIDTGANLGWTGGANVGMRHALEDGCSHVVFLNTDIRILDDELVLKLLEGFRNDPACGLISPGITLWPDTALTWYRGGRCRRPFWVPRHPGINHLWHGPSQGRVPTGSIVGCCVMGSRACLEAVKGFDERLFMYLDDPDLSLAARMNGFQTYLLDEPLVAHDKPGRRLGSTEAYYFGRNPFLLAAKYEDRWGRFLALIAQILALPVYLLRALDGRARIRYLSGFAQGMHCLMTARVGRCPSDRSARDPQGTSGEAALKRTSKLIDLLIGFLLAAGVSFPFFGRAPVFFLDFSLGPHHALINPAVYGLQGGDVLSIPLGLLISAVHAVIGSPATWLPIFLFFPLASFSLGRVVELRLIPRLGAILFFTINPFVFSRVYAGQVGVLLGYALLPLAVCSIMTNRQKGWRGGIPVAIWTTALVACTVHYAWILAIPITLCVFWERFSRRVLAWLTTSLALIIALNCYVLLANGSGDAGYRFGQADLAAFRTVGDAHYGLFVNALGLYGFWQQEATLPKALFGPWWIVIFAFLLLVMGIGAVARRRQIQQDAQQPTGLYLAVAVVAYLLSLGDQGPTGPVFRWFYFHVPLFEVMREPQKFAAMLALVEALALGWGLETLSRIRNDRLAMMLVCTASAMPILYTPTQFAGLAGQIRPSRPSSAWATADHLMGNGPGMVLVLPWQRYLAFPFTDGRVVSNPLGDFFSRGTVTGDNLDLPGLYTDSTSPRSHFLEELFAAARNTPRITGIGAVLSEMGFRYVVLANAPTANTYGSWLQRSTDMRRIYRSQSLSIWEPTEPVSAPGRRSTYRGSHASLSELATGAPAQSAVSQDVTRTSATGYAVSPGRSGWVEIDVAYQPGWTIGGAHAQALPDGDIGAEIGPAATAVSFSSSARASVGYACSGTALLVLFAGELLLRRRDESEATQQALGAP